MSNRLRILLLSLAAALMVGPATPAHAALTGPGKTVLSPNEARFGRGSGFRRPPVFSRTRRPVRRAPAYRRPGFSHGFFGGMLRALGIAYLVHALFGWGGGGGSPLGLPIVAGLVAWLFTRRRRQPLSY